MHKLLVLLNFISTAGAKGKGQTGEKFFNDVSSVFTLIFKTLSL